MTTSTPPPPAAAPLLMRLPKWAIMGAFWAVQSVALLLVFVIWLWQGDSVNGVNGKPFGQISDLREVLNVLLHLQFWIVYVCVCAGVALLQTLLLLPVAKPRARSAKGVPLALSAAAAGLIVTSLIFGVGIAGYNVVAEWSRSAQASPPPVPIESHGGAVVAPDVSETPPASVESAEVVAAPPVPVAAPGAVPAPGPPPAPRGPSRDTIVLWSIIAIVAISWLVATPLVWAFCSRRLAKGHYWEPTLRALSTRLFLGTIIEVLAIIPMDVMIRRKTDCYCLSGTLLGLSLGITAGFVVLGPIILLPLIARRRKRWAENHCEACGYDLASLLAAGRELDRCPECGVGWKR